MVVKSFSLPMFFFMSMFLRSLATLGTSGILQQLQKGGGQGGRRYFFGLTLRFFRTFNNTAVAAVAADVPKAAVLIVVQQDAVLLSDGGRGNGLGRASGVQVMVALAAAAFDAKCFSFKTFSPAALKQAVRG